MIVWAGFKWLTSGGSPERITDAKKKIGNALTGMALVLGSYLILQTVNPALVRLRTPPIKMARQEFTPAQTSCVPRPEFSCGQIYNCSNPQDISNPPCGGRGSGECIGQACSSGSQRCAALISERMVGDARNAIASVEPDDRVCVTPSACANCASITAPEICISNACNCILVTAPTSSGFICQPRLTDGAPCAENQQCANSICNTALGTCGPAPNSEECNRGSECRSGLCNTARSFLGVVGYLGEGTCVASGSLADGEPCSSSAMCQSRQCGYTSLLRAHTGQIPDCGNSYLVEIFGL